MSQITIREARDTDVPAVRTLFMKTYGSEYPYRQFYDDYWLKKAVFSDYYVFLVAVEEDRIVGTASVYYDAGTYTDLMAEFGRLVVDPAMRGRGIGKLLMEARIRFANKRLHFGFVEARTVHPFAQRIAWEYGFRPIGFFPMAIYFQGRESLACMARHFGNSRELRRNNPQVIPEIYPLAAKALTNMSLPQDLVAVEDAISYDTHGNYTVEELTESSFPALLRIERGRLKRRQLFGNLMLSYGYFALTAKEATYLVAKDGDTIAGAIGYVYDSIGKTLKVLELIDINDDVGGFLLGELDRRAREEMGAQYCDVVVSAYWPQMQRTLDRLGFCPVAYCPAYVFRGYERMDAIRMAKIYVPFDLGDLHLIPEMQEMHDLVLRGFLDKRVGIQIDNFTREVSIFAGLNDSQLRTLSGTCLMRPYSAGDVIFRQGEIDRNLYMVLDGSVNIHVGGNDIKVGEVATGDIVGEIALIDNAPHSATAVAATDVRLIVLPHQDFEILIHRYPRIGMTVMRNIARSLGKKLKTMDKAASRMYGQYLVEM